MKQWFLLLVLTAALTGCGSAKADNNGASGHDGHKPTLALKIDVSGNQATVNVITDMKISTEHYGKARQPGEGHVHMYLDNGAKMIVLKEQQVLQDLAPGTHTLKVSMHNNDHTPYDVTKILDFEIK